MKNINSKTPEMQMDVASNCTPEKHYVLITKADKDLDEASIFILSRFNSKWCWIASGGNRNFCQGHADFDVVFSRPMDDKRNIVLQFATEKEMFMFCSTPKSYQSLINI